MPNQMSIGKVVCSILSTPKTLLSYLIVDTFSRRRRLIVLPLLLRNQVLTLPQTLDNKVLTFCSPVNILHII